MNRNAAAWPHRVSTLVLALTLCGASACAKSDSAAGASGGDEAGSNTAGVLDVASVETQPADADPCKWMSQADVEAVIGKLDRAPFRNDGDEALEPAADGEVCAYVMSAVPGKIPSGVYVEVATHEGAQLTSGVMAALRGVTDWFPPGYSLGDTGVAGPWDHAAGSGKRLFAARQGDAAVILTGIGFGLPKEQLGTLAAKVLANIPDLPTAAPPVAKGREPEEEPPGDPCSFVTADEAEKVLGKLTVPPYRSRTSTSMASPIGGSCSYRTRKHRVLVLTPSWDDGKMQFRIAGITAQQTSKILGGTSAADTLEGPWDQVAGGAGGEIYFLKGDALLALQYNASSTDVGGSVTLARLALGRF